MLTPVQMQGLGTLAGGIGQLAGGLGLGGGGDGIDVSESLRLNRGMLKNAEKAEIDRLRKLKAYGIHPLFALGKGANVSYTAVPTEGRRTDPAQIGAGIERLTSAKATNTTQKAMEQLGLRQANAETLRSEYATELAWMDLQRRKQLARSNVERGGDQSVETVPARQTAHRPGDPSMSAATNPAWEHKEVAPGVYMANPAGEPLAMDEVSNPGFWAWLARGLGLWRSDIDDPKVMTERTRKQFKKWGYKPRKRSRHKPAKTYPYTGGSW